MATVHSLPTELLHRILELGSPWPPGLWEPPREGYDFLLSASLVSRVWRPAAQERLWSRVCLGKPVCAQAFVEGGARGGRKAVELTLYGAASTQLATRAINTCVGLESLTGDFICGDDLCSPALAGITSLSVYRLEENSLPPALLPFRLESIRFIHLPSPPFLDAILQPSITSLTIWLPGVRPVHIPSFTRVSHQLTSLHCIPSASGFQVLEPFFRGCVNLSNLRINAVEFGYILPLIPPLIPTALNSLTFEGIFAAAKDLKVLLDLLRATPPAIVIALSSLRCLRFEAEERFIVGSVEGGEVLNAREEKGIRVEFDV